MTPEAVASRFAASRPGYELVSYGEVGLPFYRIAITAHVLEHKPVGPFAEFALRAIDAGFADPEEIGNLLGLEQRVVEATLADLVEADHLRLSALGGSGTTVTLTPQGKNTMETATAIVPEEAVVEVDFDGLLRRPVLYVERWMTPFELRNLGLREIPPSPVRPPEIRDIDITALEKLIRVIGDRREAKREVLALRSLERKRRFLSAVALVFRGDDPADVQVAFVVDGIPSPEHEEAFSRSRFKRKLVGGDTVASAEAVVEAVLGKDIVERAHKAQFKVVEFVPGPVPAELEQEAETDLPLPTIEDPVRLLQTYEHPAFLREALATSKDRLLIVSPWVRRRVVDDVFLKALEDRLQEGVDVFIGWGITPLAEDDVDIDSEVLKRFSRLKDSFNWTFHTRRLGDTHAKVLISDQQFLIVTSFNWLSFKGDPRRTFRDERGTYVALAEKIDEQFKSYSQRIGQ